MGRVGGHVSPPSAMEGINCYSEGCGNVYSYTGIIAVATWNVEGLTDIKTDQIIDYMEEFSIGVMCMQEVRKTKW